MEGHVGGGVGGGGRTRRAGSVLAARPVATPRTGSIRRRSPRATDRQRWAGRRVRGRHCRHLSQLGTRPASAVGEGTDLQLRPGRSGWSRPVHGKRSLRRITDDLHTVIHALALPRPVVLVGHSFGTFVVRVYADRFPDDVAALVLIDPVMPDEFVDPAQSPRGPGLKPRYAGARACALARGLLFPYCRRPGVIRPGSPGTVGTAAAWWW